MSAAFASKVENYFLKNSQNESEFLNGIKNIKFEDVKEMVTFNILNNS